VAVVAEEEPQDQMVAAVVAVGRITNRFIRIQSYQQALQSS
jgi:hypothetical protein